jgi:hypothetical protein
MHTSDMDLCMRYTSRRSCVNSIYALPTPLVHMMMDGMYFRVPAIRLAKFTWQQPCLHSRL